MIFEPYSSIGGGKTEKNTSSGVSCIELISSDAGLFHCGMRTENTDVGEIRSPSCEALIWSDVAG